MEVKWLVWRMNQGHPLLRVWVPTGAQQLLSMYVLGEKLFEATIYLPNKIVRSFSRSPLILWVFQDAVYGGGGHSACPRVNATSNTEKEESMISTSSRKVKYHPV